jgi:7-carboxy-7-deazaguanine synthase
MLSKGTLRIMTETLVINEIYLSVQGESTFAGLPCVFVRLTACDLRCSYCDTAYAFREGQKQSLDAIEEQVYHLAEPYGSIVSSGRLPLIELTGGEPLLQPNSIPLMTRLCDQGFTVLLETSGAHDISAVDPRVRRIVDLKCPSSGEVSRNYWENLRHLRGTDEVKFVIGTAQDYDWAKEHLRRHGLTDKCAVLFSWAESLSDSQRDPALRAVPAGQSPISRRDLVERIIADGLPVRFQVQMHKVIWPADARSV